MTLQNLRDTLLLLAAAGAAPAWAQSTGDDQQATATTDAAAPDDIVVTAARIPQPRDQVGQSVTVIDRATIDTRQTVSVADLLATTPGVTFTRNGTLGSVTGVNIRGAQGEQTLVLIDGVRVNDPSSPGGAFDFGDLLAGNIQRIELLRGSNSVAWGSQAIGGVVNVITAVPTATPALNLAAEGGYAGTVNAHGNAFGKLGPVELSGGLAWLDTDGISSFDRALGGRERDGYSNLTANAKAKVAVAPNFSLDLRGYYIRGRLGIDGFPPPDYLFADTRERSASDQYLGYAGANLDLLGGRFKNRLAYSYFDIDRHNADPDLLSGFSEPFASKGRDQRVEYQGSFAVGPLADLVFGYEHDASYFRATSYGFSGGGQSANLDSVYGEAVVRPLTGLSVTAGVRHDAHSSFGGKTTFGANAAYTPNAGATVLRASYGEGFKAPSLYELYGDYGNDALTPETSRSWDAGIEQYLVAPRLRLAATWFHRDTHDQIDFVVCQGSSLPPCTDPNRPFLYGTYDNVARTRARGLELEVGMKPSDRFTVTGAYTYTDARDRSPGSPYFDNRLARRPVHEASVSADWTTPLGLAVGATVLHASANYDDAANTVRNEGYAIVGLRASWPITRRLEVYGRIDNLLDARYEIVNQYGTYGRSAYAGMRARF